MKPDSANVAVNYSHAAKHLYENGSISDFRWKCASNEAWINEARGSLQNGSVAEVYVHFPLDAGALDFAGTDWELITRLLDDTDTPFLNVHLNAKRDQFPSLMSAGDDNPEGLTRQREVVKDRFLRNIGFIVERFGSERIIDENVIYRGPEGPYLRASVEPELICDVIKGAGCNLLLDIAHARITCAYLYGSSTLVEEEKVKQYIEALPCLGLRELHVTGVQHHGKRLRDSMAMTDGDWDLAQWAWRKVEAKQWAEPWIVALEYGGIGPQYEWRSDASVLAKDFSILREMVLPTVPH